MNLKLDESELLMMRLLKFKYWCLNNKWEVDCEACTYDSDVDCRVARRAVPE